MILVAGEALIDFLPATCGKKRGFVYLPGGSPYNVAIGLARLEVPVAYLGAISRDFFGKLLLTHLEDNHVDVKHVIRVSNPTALSFVMDPAREGEPEYLFYGQDTADTQLFFDLLPPSFPDDMCAIHLGSLAMVREPCGTALRKLMDREHPRRLVSFDPNVRPAQITDPSAYRHKFRQWLSRVDLLKLSQADLGYIAPGVPEREAVRDWLSQGPKVIVVTLGREGARGYTDSVTVEVKARPVEVVDSVGAGDAFTAAFLAALHHLGFLTKEKLTTMDGYALERALRFAARAAEVTCTRMGADPPDLADLGAP